jgi:hypothetical protein
MKLVFSIEETLQIICHGTGGVVTEIAQLLSWISAAMSLSPFSSGKIAYCDVDIIHSKRTGTDQAADFYIERSFEELHMKESPCWLQLFNNAVIARGFPTPDRRDEIGLELSVGLMAALTGTRHATEYKGGVVMKGLSTMLVPIERNGNRVQWHLVVSEDCEKGLTYQEGLKKVPNRALLDVVSLDAVHSTRAFVGWCKNAETILGLGGANYGNIDYSGAKDAGSSLKLSAITLGFQQFGLAQFDFAFGPKDGKFHCQRTGPFRTIVSIAEKTPIVLYDTGEKRAWLVAASDVLLHVAQHRHWLEPFTVNGKPIKFQSKACAKDTLLSNGLIDLQEDEKHKFRDEIAGIWSRLEYLLGHKVSEDCKAGLAMNLPLKEEIVGYEFKAIVQDNLPMRKKCCTIAQTHGGWPKLVQDIDAVVLLANGFGDVIRPRASSRSLCKSWTRLPTGNDYLATTIKMIEGLYDVSGCRQSHQYLSSTRLIWDRGDSALFESCSLLNSSRCDCSRLQRIVSGSKRRQITPPGELEINGAVIFGGFSSRLRKIISLVRSGKLTQLYSQSNTNPIDPVDEEESAEESETSSRLTYSTSLGSDRADPLAASSITSWSQEDNMALVSKDNLHGSLRGLAGEQDSQNAA